MKHNSEAYAINIRASHLLRLTSDLYHAASRNEAHAKYILKNIEDVLCDLERCIETYKQGGK